MLSKENYLLLDHRAYDGRMVEAATYTCRHCTTIMVKNPSRDRERGYCQKCDSYICDSCVSISRRPDYVHRPWKQVVDLVREGKAILLPGSTHGEPKLLFLKGS